MIKSCLIFLMLSFFLVTSASAQNTTFEKNVQEFITDFLVRLENGEATLQDLAVCQNLGKMTPDETAKRSFLLLAAQYQRKIAKNPALCVEMLLPTVRVLKVEPNLLSKKNSKQPTSLKVPPLEEWKIDAGNALCAVEIANCLLDDGQTELALQIIDQVGQNFSDESRVLAAETGGDLYVKMKMNDRAVEFYSFGLKVLETLKKKEYEPGKGERIFFSQEQEILKTRIKRKRAIAQKLLDADHFGPDWVAYRDAQEKHFANDFLTAYWLYGKILSDYPDTIYAEAARCYRIVLLTKFADIPNLEKVPDLLKAKQKELSELQLKLLSVKKIKRRIRNPKISV